MAAGFGIRAAGVGQVALRYYALFIASGFFFFLFNYYYFFKRLSRCFYDFDRFISFYYLFMTHYLLASNPPHTHTQPLPTSLFISELLFMAHGAPMTAPLCFPPPVEIMLGVGMGSGNPAGRDGHGGAFNCIGVLEA